MSLNIQNPRIQIINLKDQIQSKCKFMSFIQPVYYHYIFHNQKIPVVNIGKIIFHSKNLMMDDNSKWIKILKEINEILNDKTYIKENSSSLSTGMLDDVFSEMFDLSNNTSCLVNTTIAESVNKFVEYKI